MKQRLGILLVVGWLAACRPAPGGADSLGTPSDSTAPEVSSQAPAGVTPAMAATSTPIASSTSIPAAPADSLPKTIAISLQPATPLDQTHYVVSGPVQVSVTAPGAMRVEFYTAPTGTGMPPVLEYTDNDGDDGWAWSWQAPIPSTHVWAEAIFADGARATTQILMIVPPDPASWQTYTNPELGYTLQYPAGWQITDFGSSSLTKEVNFSPPNAEPFIAYLSILLESRTLEQIESQYATLPGVTKTAINFAGEAAIRYDYEPPSERVEIFAPHQGRIYLIATDRPALTDVWSMLTSFTFSDAPPACDRHTASVELTTAPATNLSLGQYVVARVTLRNQGCLALGLPQYTLRIEIDPSQPVLQPEAPEPIVHSLAVQPGEADTAEFVLQAGHPGQATLRAEVSFEVHVGYPGPAYWGSATSPSVTVHASPNVFLKPPDSYEPAAGICGEASGDVVAIMINPDVPSPRCVKVAAQQKLKYINATGAPLRVAFWTFDVEIAPGGEHVFEMPVGNYLLPGVHSLGGAEVWLIDP